MSSSSESGAGKAPGHQQACPGAVEKEPATLSGSVLGALQTHAGLSPRPAPFTSVGYRCLGGKSRGEQSRWTEAPCQHRLRAPSVPGPQAAHPPGHPTRQWLPSTLCGCWLYSFCGTKLAPDQGGAGSAASPASKQLALALCLHPQRPPQVRPCLNPAEEAHGSHCRRPRTGASPIRHPR